MEPRETCVPLALAGAAAGLLVLLAAAFCLRASGSCQQCSGEGVTWKKKGPKPGGKGTDGAPHHLLLPPILTCLMWTLERF